MCIVLNFSQFKWCTIYFLFLKLDFDVKYKKLCSLQTV